MSRKIVWPHNKKFAFTIVDDTDNSCLSNIKPIYDYLLSKGILTTKTTWVYPSRNHYFGDTLMNDDYLKYLLMLKTNGFEIGLHNVGSGDFSRSEIIEGINLFKEKIGDYPNLHINHSNNKDNIYWGYERFYGLTRFIYKNIRKTIPSFGNDSNSGFFWGDYCKKYFKYIRGKTFNNINTLKEDKYLVYEESEKQKYSNYWFSSSSTIDGKSFKKLLTKKNIDKLERENGCCILYTHFAYGFLDENGKLDEEVKDVLDYLSKKDGWFVPASTILDFVVSENKRFDMHPSKYYLRKLSFKWLVERGIKG